MSLGKDQAKFVFDTAAIAISAMITDAVARCRIKVAAEKQAVQSQEGK
jgi:hypothetical protein